VRADHDRVDQLSLPYRIALVGLLVVGVLYLVVLRPTDETVPAATPAAAPAAVAPGVQGLTTAVDKAAGAAATQAKADAATAAAGGAAGATSATTPASSASSAKATTPAAAPAAASSSAATKPVAPEAAADPSSTILAELRRGHTAVVLFAGPKASDDRAVRRAVQRIDRRGGKVDVHVVSIRRVGAHEAITRNVQVLQAPTILVIGRQRTARTIVGYTTTAEIDQLVADVRRG
jgi:hypothetical protein